MNPQGPEGKKNDVAVSSLRFSLRVKLIPQKRNSQGKSFSSDRVSLSGISRHASLLLFERKQLINITSLRGARALLSLFVFKSTGDDAVKQRLSNDDGESLEKRQSLGQLSGL